MDKENVIYIQICILFRKKGEKALPFSTTLMNPGYIVVGKTGQRQKPNHFSHMWNLKILISTKLKRISYQTLDDRKKFISGYAIVIG